MVSALTASALVPQLGLGSLSTGGGATGQTTVPGGTTLQQTNIMLPGTDMRQFGNEVLRNASQALTAGNTVLGVGLGSVQSGMASPGTFFGGNR